MSNTLRVRIVEDGELSPIVGLTITRGEPTRMPWRGLLLDALRQPVGDTLTLRVASPGQLGGYSATVAVRRHDTPLGQPVIGLTPLQAVPAAATRVGSDSPDLARRNGNDGHR